VLERVPFGRRSRVRRGSELAVEGEVGKPDPSPGHGAGMLGRMGGVVEGVRGSAGRNRLMRR